MERKDIEHLATLSRIALKSDEADTLAKDITSILGYVSVINEITGNTAHAKEVGVHFNSMREDKNPHEAGMYTEALLSAAPKRDKQYIEVKKILGEKS